MLKILRHIVALHGMSGVNFFVLPQRHCLRQLHASRASRFARCVHIDDALVGRAAEAQRNVVQVVFERPVDQHVDAIEQTIGELGEMGAAGLKLVERIARKAPTNSTNPS